MAQLNMPRIQPSLQPPGMFHLFDDFVFWSFRIKLLLSSVPPEQHGQLILSYLDDSAARRIVHSGLLLPALPDTIWTHLTSLLDTRPPSNVSQSLPNVNPLANTSMFHSHPPARNFSAPISIPDRMCSDLGTVTTTKPVSQFNRTRGFTQTVCSSPDNEADN
ncbi:hypothetical protein CRM22_003664 [Opisthorchis felineus]|uniref:Uncharacterized protein n=1 Tax=Opisthorchis felineus TaxID=147828 RepID=A0A4S2M699_OPIFE|nr:hypothetical protein CRM22_003664 [Opisthorchis felineus]